jgi:hypothetical protein
VTCAEVPAETIEIGFLPARSPGPEANEQDANATDDWHSLEAQARAIAIPFLKVTIVTAGIPEFIGATQPIPHDVGYALSRGRRGGGGP